MCFLRYGNIFFLVKFVSLGMQYMNTLISNTDAVYQYIYEVKYLHIYYVVFVYFKCNMQINTKSATLKVSLHRLTLYALCLTDS